MRRNEKRIINKEVIREILQKAQICRIAIFADEYPYIVPMNYGYRNSVLYLHSALEGRKIELLKQNGNVGFEIEQEHKVLKDELSCNWTTKYRSIIGYGNIELISDKKQKVDGLNVIMEHHGKKENVYNDKAVDNVIVLKLHIKDLTAKQSGQW